MLVKSYIYYFRDESPWPLFLSEIIYDLALFILFGVLVMVALPCFFGVIADVGYRFRSVVNISVVWGRNFLRFLGFHITFLFKSVVNISGGVPTKLSWISGKNVYFLFVETISFSNTLKSLRHKFIKKPNKMPQQNTIFGKQTPQVFSAFLLFSDLNPGYIYVSFSIIFGGFLFSLSLILFSPYSKMRRLRSLFFALPEKIRFVFIQKAINTTEMIFGKNFYIFFVYYCLCMLINNYLRFSILLGHPNHWLLFCFAPIILINGSLRWFGNLGILFLINYSKFKITFFFPVEPPNPPNTPQNNDIPSNKALVPVKESPQEPQPEQKNSWFPKMPLRVTGTATNTAIDVQILAYQQKSYYLAFATFLVFASISTATSGFYLYQMHEISIESARKDALETAESQAKIARDDAESQAKIAAIHAKIAQEKAESDARIAELKENKSIFSNIYNILKPSPSQPKSDSEIRQDWCESIDNKNKKKDD